MNPFFYHNQRLFVPLLLFIQLVLWVADIAGNSLIPRRYTVSSRGKVPVFSFYNGGKTSLARLYFKNEDFSG